MSVQVISDTLYLLGQSNTDPGLFILDATSVMTPTLLGSYPVFGFDMQVVGKYAYVTGPNLNIIDISNPISPTLVSSSGGYISGYRIAVANSIALLADGLEGVKIIDVSNPVSPILKSTFHPPGYAMQVAAAGELGYVTYNYGETIQDYIGLKILDISNPEAPETLGTYRFLDAPKDLKVAGKYAYILSGPDYSSGDGNLRIIDISNPLYPREVGYFKPGDTVVSRVAVDGENIYLASWNGLFVLWFQRIDIYLPVVGINQKAAR